MNSSELNASRRAIFFDRDGIVNHRRVDDYVKSWEEFEFLPGIFTILPRVRAAGFRAILITNQRGIARGMMTQRALEEIHAAMQLELERRSGARFDAIYFCPHERDAGCDCRKPLPGMLHDAARDHAIDLAASWMIGDTESDIVAGHAAGCRAILVGDSGTANSTTSSADAVTASLEEAWAFIERSPLMPAGDGRSPGTGSSMRD